MTPAPNSAVLDASATVLDDADLAVDSETPAVLDELLVEEISIDGMCGVY